MDNTKEMELLENLELTSLIDVDTLQKIQDAFSNMFGMAALTTDIHGVAVTKGSNFTDFCMKYTRTSKEGCKKCEKCDKTGAEIAIQNGHSSAYHCHAGLVDFAAPILVNNVMIGSFIGGQVLTTEPDYEKLKSIAEELNIDYEEYKIALSKIRITNDEQVEKAAEFLYIFAQVLSRIAYDAYKLRLSNFELEKASRAKSDFLANMSHEIRTPMNAVLGLADMALREDMTPLAKAYLHQIKASGKNLLVIINDILDFSKVESGKMEIIEDNYEPYSLCNDLSGIVISRIREKNIEFIMDVSPELPQKMYGDNVRIHQVILNLLTNSVKYTEQGRVKLTITPKEQTDYSVILCVSVSDTGIGIKPEDQEKIFNSFQQVDSKRNRNIEGTGLGLPLSNQILRLMGSEIKLKSEYNKGSVFSFELKQKVIDSTPTVLPLEKTRYAMIKIENEYVRDQLIKDLQWIGVECVDMLIVKPQETFTADYYILEKKFYSEELENELSKNPVKCILIEDFIDNYVIDSNRISILKKPIYFLNLYNVLGITNIVFEDSDADKDIKFIAPEAKILVVDDNTINLTVAKGMMEPIKAQVDVAEGALQALSLLEQERYDIVFMDHMMPKIDGVEATKMIRERFPMYNNMPIIALTANAVSGAKEMFLRVGMVDFVAKPIEYTKLISTIKKWLPEEKIEEAITENTSQTNEVPIANEDDFYNIPQLNVAEAVKMLGNLSLFKNVLEEYYHNIDKKSETIRDSKNKGDIRNYTIDVHALKSASRQIGAYELADLAANLEKAGNEHDLDFIYKHTDELLEIYHNYKNILAPYFDGKETVLEKKTATPEIIQELIEEILEAVDSFDTLFLDETITKMDNYTYSKQETEIFEKLKEAAEIFDADTIISLANNWKQL